MAKKKAKRRRKSKPQVQRKKTPFVGDQILALYHFFGTCCVLGLLSLVGSLALGVSTVASNKNEVLKHVQNKDVTGFINGLKPDSGIIVFCIAGALFIFAILTIRATWQGRKWAFWVTLLTNAPGATLSAFAGQTDSRYGSLIPVVVSIYCILRLAGSVGPKM